MMRVLAALWLLLFAALGWQSWQLAQARQTIATQQHTLKSSAQALTTKNNQLRALSTLTAASAREQTRLYAAAERTTALLHQRQHQTEELKRENDDLRHWADTPLPADIARLRERPALTGGATYRQWLSASDTVPVGKIGAAQ